MHDYTAWQVHEDRIRELTRDADASRLAATARGARPELNPGTPLRRWLSAGLSRLSIEAWRWRPSADVASRILAWRPR
jgi:hypothetical protein